jgi:hypothetical protein
MSQEDDRLSDAEIAKRRDEALLRTLNTPPKPHSAMKLGKRKANTSPKVTPPKNVRGQKKHDAKT